MDDQPKTTEPLTAPVVDTPTVPKRYIADYTGKNVPPERRATIFTLADTLNLTPSAIADRLKMDYRTVKVVLATRDYDAVAARNVLDCNALTAANAWVKSIKAGAIRGRHEPARDLLLHRKVIEPIVNQSVSASVQVVLTGGELPHELRPNPQPFALEIETKSETPSE